MGHDSNKIGSFKKVLPYEGLRSYKTEFGDAHSTRQDEKHVVVVIGEICDKSVALSNNTKKKKELVLNDED